MFQDIVESAANISGNCGKCCQYLGHDGCAAKIS